MTNTKAIEYIAKPLREQNHSAVILYLYLINSLQQLLHINVRIDLLGQ